MCQCDFVAVRGEELKSHMEAVHREIINVWSMISWGKLNYACYVCILMFALVFILNICLYKKLVYLARN